MTTSTKELIDHLEMLGDFYKNDKALEAAQRLRELQEELDEYCPRPTNGQTDHSSAGCIKRGVKPPKPKTEAELLAEQFSQALRDEHRRDPETGLDYRANHAFKERHGDKQLTFWVQLENATHQQMSASVTNRRDGIIADCVQLKKDSIVWNNKNPNEKQINMVLDFEEDTDERLASEGYVQFEVS